MTQQYIVKIQDLIEIFGSSLELWAIYGQNYLLNWREENNQFLHLANGAIWQAFPRVLSLIKIGKGTGKGINSLVKTSM